MKKLKEILLVDDSMATNVLNKRLLMALGVVDHIAITTNGKEALEYLSTPNAAGEYPTPEIVFLDINMPVMDGFQFLDRHAQLDPEMKARFIIVLLTTSIRTEDQEKAAAYGSDVDFLNKPLTAEAVQRIIRTMPN